MIRSNIALCFSSLVFLKAKMLLESMQSAKTDCTLSWLGKFLQYSYQLTNFIPKKKKNCQIVPNQVQTEEMKVKSC